MNTSIKFLAILLLLTSLFLVKGLAERNQEQEPSPEEVTPVQIAKAKQIFKDKCARCHGVDGRGQTVLGQMLNPPDFTEEKWIKSDLGNNVLSATIRSGKGEMPAFGKKLTRQEITYLIAYIRSFNKSAEKQ